MLLGLHIENFDQKVTKKGFFWQKLFFFFALFGQNCQNQGLNQTLLLRLFSSL